MFEIEVQVKNRSETPSLFVIHRNPEMTSVDMLTDEFNKLTRMKYVEHIWIRYLVDPSHQYTLHKWSAADGFQDL